MKKNNILAFGILALVILIVTLYSCSKSDSYWSTPAAKSNSLSVSDAKNWFEGEFSSEISDIKNIQNTNINKSRLVSYARGVFAGVPDWGYHQVYRHNANGLIIQLDFPDTATRYRGFRDVIIVKNNVKKTLNAYVQLELFNTAYLKTLKKTKGNLPDIRYYSDPATFTGEVLMYSIHNEFIRGAQYKDGRIIARIFPKNGISGIIRSISNSMNVSGTYVPYNGGANLDDMNNNNASKKVALQASAQTAAYEEAVARTASSSSGTSGTDGDSNDSPIGTGDLGSVTVIATKPNTNTNNDDDSYGDSYEDTRPTGSDPTPTDPPEGEPPPPPPLDPCAKAKAGAQNATNISKTAAYGSGKTLVNNASADGNEHSVAFDKDGNGNIIPPTTVSTGGETNTTTLMDNNTVATLHNHPNPNQPPSAGDVYDLINSNIGLNNYEAHPNFTTKYVVVGNTTYALIITDRVAAQSFVTTYSPIQIGNNSPDFPSTVFDDYQDVLDGVLNNQELNEEALAYVLDKYNSGIALLKEDANGNFNKLGTSATPNSNGTTTYAQTNCNN